IREYPIASRPLLDAFNVRWVVVNAPLSVDGLELRKTFDDLPVYHFGAKMPGVKPMAKTYLYENMKVLPRAALVRRRIQTPSAAADKFAAVRAADLRTTVIVEPPLETGDLSGPEFQAVEVDHRIDSMTMTVNTGAGGGYLVLSEVWFPGWQAYVDEVPVRTMPANGIFQTIELGPGAHQVTLRYLPRAVIVGSWCSAVGLLCSFILLTVGKKPTQAASPDPVKTKT
ncbi:MAG: YfhO family protein, partial [Planctomycetia bacterium]